MGSEAAETDRADGASTRSDADGAIRERSSPPVPQEHVCVLIPTLEEEATIGDVIDDFRERGFENFLVVDGGSADRTREIARDHGASVLTQSGTGKGQAVREGVDHVDVPYVLMLDGDGTYDSADANRMLAPLAAGYEHVIGDRFADMEPGAMTRLNGFGNRLINRAFRSIHGADFGDILSGYRAFTTDSFRRCNLSADGFTIETELAVECRRQGIETAVVPISYSDRPTDSETNLSPFRDGGRIIVALYSLTRTNNPLFFFGSLGIGSLLSGGLVAAFVLVRYLFYGVGHEILAVVSAAAIILGVQLLMFAVLSDMIATFHRDQRQRLDRLAKRVGDDDRAFPRLSRTSYVEDESIADEGASAEESPDEPTPPGDRD